MAKGSWTLDLPEGSRRVDATYGYWLGKATVRVDGQTVLAARPLLRMAYDRGVDLRLRVDGHDLIVMIRPDLRGPRLVTGYRFGLTVDGVAAPGTKTIPPIVPTTSLARTIVESIAWSAGGGVAIGLSGQGTNPVAFTYLLAPAACSLVVRRSKLPTGWLVLICTAILIGGIGIVAGLSAVLRR